MDTFEVNKSIWGASARGDLTRLQEIFDDPQGRGPEQINERNTYGYTPIQAANFTTSEVVEFLLERGANPNVSDESLRTPLSDALHQGSEESAKILIQHGADVTCIDQKGETPLHIAVRKCSLEVVQLLWSVMDVHQRTLRNAEGKSPLDIARESRRDDGAARESRRDDGAAILAFLQSEEQPVSPISLLQQCRTTIRSLFGRNLHLLRETLTDILYPSLVDYLLLNDIPRNVLE